MEYYKVNKRGLLSQAHLSMSSPMSYCCLDITIHSDSEKVFLHERMEYQDKMIARRYSYSRNNIKKKLK